MSRNRRNEDRNNRNSTSSNWGAWGTALGMVGGAAAIGGLTYWLTKGNTHAQSQQESAQTSRVRVSEEGETRRIAREDRSGTGVSGVADYLSELVQRASGSSPRAGPVMSYSSFRVPRLTNMSRKKNLDLYLGEVFKQNVAIKDDDYKKAQEVFKSVFDQVKTSMGDKCNYFKKYSSEIMYAGSVTDGLKVSKLDEFDMDIIIRLPINMNEIIIECDQPGFVKVKIEHGFDHLDKQKEWENCHKVTREWRDSDKYFLQSKFRQWIHGIVQKALNDMNFKATVNGVTYLLKYKESGPAWTLNVTNDMGNEEFKLDVDLVPVIKFQHPRWPEGYRQVEESIVKDWLVVPKPNKALTDEAKNRSWRLSFQNFEKDMMKGCQQLKNTIRLLKKLRDSLQMKDIASYYIKTLFLWKIDDEKDKKYWQKSISTMFRIMVEELHQALVKRNISYFWHKDNNLIQKLKPTVLKVYTDKLKEVLDSIDANNADKVASYLLTIQEYQEFKKSDFYVKVKIAEAKVILNNELAFSRQESNSSNGVSVTDSQQTTDTEDSDQSLVDLLKSLNKKIDSMSNNNQKQMKKIESDLNANGTKPLIALMRSFDERLDSLIEKFDDQNDRLMKLEKEMKSDREALNDRFNLLLDRFKIVDTIDGSRGDLFYMPE